MLQHKLLLLLLTPCSELVFFSFIILLRETDITDELVRPDFTHILDTDLMQLASTVVTHNESTAAVLSVTSHTSLANYIYNCVTRHFVYILHI